MQTRGYVRGQHEAAVVSKVLLVLTALAAPNIRAADVAVLQPKVLIITMFGGEAQPWLQAEHFTSQIMVPGLSKAYPALKCTAQQLCLMTTDRGYANAASSVTALLFNRQFDFRRTYVFVAGIAGVDPIDGSLGSAHWARYAVDGGLQQEIDARQIPVSWPTGYLGIGAQAPGAPSGDSYGTEVYRLNEALLQRAYRLTVDLPLQENMAVELSRSLYPEPAAQAGPKVSICDTVSSDTWWYGSRLDTAMNAWAKVQTAGQGNFCTTQQEDNATLTALQRASEAHLFDFSRVAVLRTAADFDQEPAFQPPAEALRTKSGGYLPAVSNAYTVVAKVAHIVIDNWRAWQNGVPR